MSEYRLRFIHCGGLLLHEPLRGVAEVPEHLAERMLEAPQRAMQRMVDHALSAGADFVILSGEVVRPSRAVPWALADLVKQFERLAMHRVPVYWAGSLDEADDPWPTAIRLPENVHRFGAARPTEFVFTRSGQSVAHLTGLSQTQPHVAPSDFWPHAQGLFSIAVACGELDAQVAAQRGINYWAVGGRSSRATLHVAPTTIHYPGQLQGRAPDQSGPFGCTLVDVEPGQSPSLTLLGTETLRYCSALAQLDETTTRAELETRLAAQLDELLAHGVGIDLLVRWTLGGSGSLLRQLARGPLAAEVLQSLRKTYGHRNPLAWSDQLRCELPRPRLPENSPTDDSLAQALERLAAECAALDDAESAQLDPLGLQTLSTDASLPPAIAHWVRPPRGAARQRTLAQAVALSSDLLSGDA